MNNKGFTLIEVLAVLVILSIIMGLALPAFTSSMEKTKRKQGEIYKDKICGAMEMFVADYKFNPSAADLTVSGSVYTTSISNLIVKGYLSSGDIKNDDDKNKSVVYNNDSHECSIN